ncbi:MAG: GNAT family N-acetyltransferase [Bernardetiaceae bacterium]|nr:GNAT family N-acetyltransferase [Bernardetiaceae bacterium]
MYTIRKARKEDVPVIFSLIEALAVFEKAPHEVDNTAEQLALDAFGDTPHCRIWVAESHEGEIIAMALCYTRYSTWKGACLYLEDLYVLPEWRNRGIAKAFFKLLIEVAKSEHMAMMVWQVLDWNEPAIAFYKKIGAELDGEWINCRLKLNA